MHTRLLCPLLLLAPLAGWAQLDTAHRMPEVTVTARAVAFQAGAQRIALDSFARQVLLAQPAADWLARQTPAFVRAYGPGGLATPGVRGTSANHTAVVWNGLLVNSPTFGTTDLSLLPVGGYQALSLQLGGAGALYGTGFVGGALHYTTEAPTDSTHGYVSLSAGSFGTYRSAAGVQARSGKLWLSLEGLAATSANDFTYTYRAFGGDATRHRQHASYRQATVLPALGARLGQHELALYGWVQAAHRELPAVPSSAVPGTATQTDGSARLLLRHRYLGTRWQLDTRLAYLSERIDYNANPARGARGSVADTRQLQAEAEARTALSPALGLLVGLSHTHAWAQNTEYASTPRSRTAAFGALRYAAGGLAADLSLRQEVSEADLGPLTPALSARYQWWRFTAHGQVGRVYRLPTFNERFWPPGNPDLGPEAGVGADAGLGYSPTEAWAFDLTGFYTLLEGWVVWQQGPEGLRPRNLQRVRSRGLELSGRFQQTWGYLRILASAGYTYTQAHILESPLPQEVGQQNLYTPYHQGWALVRVGYRQLWAQYQQQATGLRYGRTDGGGRQDPYTTGHVSLGARYRGVALVGQVANVWNVRYEVLPADPMPGRACSLSVQFHF